MKYRDYDLISRTLRPSRNDSPMPEHTQITLSKDSMNQTMEPEKY